ncbi:ImmA/IrrE family metallo-endopeptidase [Desulfatitalea tepidiphila]|uniref:ImmA/IrrE family metallo-endopeptidase n=1 Tax=Desulfatitalea tepidiphila TaxID=1185843 RepID=UPI0006B414DF|nr:ImmA/IrrE family metallo-endopeptidase [Desulfatitalea tepidiphila]
MIYTAIKTLEKRWPLFNREPLTKAHCLKLLEEMGVIALEDRQVPEAMALWYQKKAFVIYNPHLSDSDLVLNIGHELGHFALGHIKSTRLPILSRIFSKTIEEKDAGIIGFLMWAPTAELCRMYDKGRLNIEELYRYVKFRDGDIEEDKALRLCHSRIRIFNGLQRTLRQLRMPVQFRVPPYFGI